LRVKEGETRLILHEHDDDDDDISVSIKWRGTFCPTYILIYIT